MSYRLSLHPANFCVIRSCALPFDTLTKGLGSTCSIRKTLSLWLKHPTTINALALASPSTLDRLHYWQQDPDSTKAKKIEQTLIKYFIRMSTRPTPFGLFAGISYASVGEDKTTFGFQTNEPFKRHTRIDFEVLFELGHRLSRQNWLSSNLPCQINPTVYRLGDQYRYIKGTKRQGNWHYQWVSLEVTPQLATLIEVVSDSMSAKEILLTLQASFQDDSAAKVRRFLRHCIELKLVIPGLTPAITAADPHQGFLSYLHQYGFTQQAKQLNTLQEQCRHLDKKILPEADDYRRLIKTISSEFDAKHCLQVDMFRDTVPLNLNIDAANSFLHDLSLLHQLMEKKLNPFRRMINRITGHSDGRLFPLKAMLDDELGWSFSTTFEEVGPLLDNLSVKKPPIKKISPRLKKIDHLLMSLLTEMADPFQDEVLITNKALRALPVGPRPKLPVCFGAMLSMYQSALDQPDASPVFYLHSCHGPSPAKLTARFCHLDRRLLQKTRDLLALEQSAHPEAILAEVVHYPEGRLGNISARIALREYEIPILGTPSADDDKIISLDDLFIYVEQRELKLWSTKHQKQVIPRLSSAHAHDHQSIGIYHFLGKLQLQNKQLPQFKWHPIFLNRSYLPRVRIGQTLLSKRRWNIPRATLVLLATHNSTADYSKAWQALQQRYHLPDYVCCCSIEPRLTLYLANRALLSILLEETKEQQQVALEEVLQHALRPLCTTAGKPLSHEIILPIINRSVKSKTMAGGEPGRQIGQAHIDASTYRRAFAPGSEWLSIKIYSGALKIDRLLVVQGLIDLIDKLRKTGCFTQCFYVRFADPDYHLRLRFKGKSEHLLTQVLTPLSVLIQPLIDEGSVKAMVLDTYQQEAERYGGIAGMALAEQYFDANSALCFAILQLFSEEHRFLALLKGLDDLLQVMGLSLREKFERLCNWREKMSKQCGDSRALRKANGKKYQAMREDITHWLSDTPYNHSDPNLPALFNRHQQVFNDVIQQLNRQAQAQRLTREVVPIVGTFVHMFNNRIFVLQPLQHEYLAYDLLRRHYQYLLHKKSDI